MTYKCIRSFTSKSGKNYYYGNEIGGIAYTSMPANERLNFIAKENSSVSESRPSSALPDFNTNPIHDIGSFGNDFGGFGGGDSGGAGASGDY